MSYVHEVLFPYARARIGEWFTASRGTDSWHAVVAGVRTHLGSPDLDEAGVRSALTGWSDRDVKAPPLKMLQGLLWSSGYADGTLHGHVYDEVPGVLAQWSRAGIAQFIYSSGSVAAQRDWFAHTRHGDLTRRLSGFFDLETAGGKRSAASYAAISAAIGVPAAQTLFLSDVAEELDAAAAAGWLTTGVRRDGDHRGRVVPGHHTVSQLDAGLAVRAG
ncbi:acireductone synthase [Micromonospora sp. ALFpr18c]|nr:acireductone synthase [Micromonospora sp. ALFpr18c]